MKWHGIVPRFYVCVFGSHRSWLSLELQISTLSASGPRAGQRRRPVRQSQTLVMTLRLRLKTVQQWETKREEKSEKCMCLKWFSEVQKGFGVYVQFRTHTHTHKLGHTQTVDYHSGPGWSCSTEQDGGWQSNLSQNDGLHLAGITPYLDKRGHDSRQIQHFIFYSTNKS